MLFSHSPSGSSQPLKSGPSHVLFLLEHLSCVRLSGPSTSHHPGLGSKVVFLGAPSGGLSTSRVPALWPITLFYFPSQFLLLSGTVLARFSWPVHCLPAELWAQEGSVASVPPQSGRPGHSRTPVARWAPPTRASPRRTTAVPPRPLQCLPSGSVGGSAAAALHFRGGAGGAARCLPACLEPRRRQWRQWRQRGAGTGPGAAP